MMIDTIQTYSRSDTDNGHKTQETEINTSTPDYRSFGGRLRTYRNWPNQDIAPEALAKAGFYYLGRDDIVQCPYCFVEGYKWQRGDQPMEDHKTWNQHCPFILMSNTESDRPEEVVPTNRSEDTCGKFGNIEVCPLSVAENECKDLEKLGVQKTKDPTHTNYITEERRLASFANWPKALKQKPAVLAGAGFYYTGVGDQTICYHCGGGLKDWEDNDDPYEQHAKWFPKCIYINLKKGCEYVENIAKGVKPEDQPSSSTSTSETKEKNCDTQSDEDEDDISLCKICYKNQLGVVFLPCGHIVACVDCGSALKSCPVCRKPVQASVRSFLS